MKSENIKRNDIHSPKNIIPGNYVFIAAFPYAELSHDLGASFEIAAQRDALNSHKELTGAKYASHKHGGQCQICGSVNAINIAIFYHKDTNEYIRTGFDCAEKMQYDDKGLFRKIKTEYDALRKAKAGKLKAAALLKENDLFEFAESLHHNGFQSGRPIYCENETGIIIEPFKSNQDLKWKYETSIDVIGKLIKYGSLSEKQWKFLKTLKNQIENFNELLKEKIEKEKHVPDVPTGRVVIKGSIISTKAIIDDYDGHFICTKMLVQADAGYKIWVTLPSSISDANKGDKVQFSATLKPSDKDSKFGLGSRPTKAIIL